MPFSSKERDQELFRSIVEAHQHIQRYVDQMQQPEFLIDAKTQDAVAMRLQQILECANKLSTETKDRLKINWLALTAMRNKISHHYDSVDPVIVWQVITDFPEFTKLVSFAKDSL